MQQKFDNKESLNNKSDTQNDNNSDSEITPGLFNADNVSAGAALRIARKNKGMSYEDVGEELNLSNSVLEAIENDAWEHLPEATYVRGYIRAYARLLGLDPADVMMSFRYNNSEQNISLDSMPRGIEEPTLRVASFPRKLKIFLFLLAVIAGILFLFIEEMTQWWETEIVSTQSTADTKTASSTNNAGAGNTSTSADSRSSSSLGATSSASNNAEQAATNTDNATPSNSANSTSNSDIAASGMLELQFTATSWVDIRDKSGKKVVYKSFPPGEAHSVKASLPLSVFIGNADAVTMTYQGRTIDLQQYKEEVYAKFQLTTTTLN